MLTGQRLCSHLTLDFQPQRSVPGHASGKETIRSAIDRLMGCEEEGEVLDRLCPEVKGSALPNCRTPRETSALCVCSYFVINILDTWHRLHS